MSASASLLHRRNPYRLWFAAGGALALAVGGVGTTAALLGLVADDANVPRGTPAALAATNAALLLTSLVCWTRRELWLLRVLSLGVKSSADAISREEPLRAGLSRQGTLKLFLELSESADVLSESASDMLRAAVAAKRAGSKFMELSPLVEAHKLAERYHVVANVVNVGTAALLDAAGKEAEAVLRGSRPGRRQALLPKYKHIDVAVNDLKQLQHLLHCSKAMQLQTALIAPHQQLKPKLETLGRLEEEHGVKVLLRQALVETAATMSVEQMLAVLTQANTELYDVIGQLAIALGECLKHNGEYDLFEDSGLHSAEVLSAIPDSFPVLLEARL